MRLKRPFVPDVRYATFPSLKNGLMERPLLPWGMGSGWVTFMITDEKIIIPASAKLTETLALNVLIAISASHLMNDLVQSMIPTMIPIFERDLDLNFAQAGIIQAVFLITASILQPMVGIYNDRYPQPFSLALGMAASLAGVLVLSMASTYMLVLVAAALIGTGSSVFHPESSRVARMASGGQHGLAQSVFQVGGYAGAALGPLLAAVLIIPYGQHNLAYVGLVALVAIGVLVAIGFWSRAHQRARKKASAPEPRIALSPVRLKFILAILGVLVFSKAFYMASMNVFFVMYLTNTFQMSMQHAQLYLFAFLASVAIGALAGGPIGDRIGRKAVIWFSILGVLPFTLMLPHANPFWTGVLTVVIGLILSSAFSAILVYAQELVPGKVGLIAGLFFGLSFGLGGVGAALLGWLADHTSIGFVYELCAFLPFIGVLAIFLPNTRRKKLA